jgi:hypothetical protein
VDAAERAGVSGPGFRAGLNTAGIEHSLQRRPCILAAALVEGSCRTQFTWRQHLDEQARGLCFGVRSCRGAGGRLYITRTTGNCLWVWCEKMGLQWGNLKG